MVAKLANIRKNRRAMRAKKIVAWLFVAGIALLGLFLIFYNLRLYQKRAELQERAQELQAEIAELSQRKEELQRQVEVSVTPEYQERVLREQGLYQKPGEQVVTILPAEEPEVEEQKEKVWWNPFTWFSRE